MPSHETKHRTHALAIWQAGVDAVRPEVCLPRALSRLVKDHPDWLAPGGPGRILIVGGGKAGAAMSLALRNELAKLGIDPGRIEGFVNVPGDTVIPIPQIHLHAARPRGVNYPTEEARRGAERILEIAAAAGPDDVLICLISGGGSALLPAPVEGVNLADKQDVTKLLHECGATIQEMNTVRKHLSLIKGGGLVRHFMGKRIISLIISDVIGDSLDVIASGPTAPDPRTFSDALAVLDHFQLRDRTPRSVLEYLERGAAGNASETLKELPRRVENLVIANNQQAIDAARLKAEELGYYVVDLGSSIAGETRSVAEEMTTFAREQPAGTCILSGGETTVTLGPDHGLGGRNQEFVLAFLCRLGREGIPGITVLSGGTDGEDGPTDAAGAIGDAVVLEEAERLDLQPEAFLARHDAYPFFEQTGGLLKTGLTQTNVMDLRVILAGQEQH